jgi:phage terminase large subunit-like protein
VREFVCLIPRGSGKTTLLAAFALHHLRETEDAEVYVAPPHRQQATILFGAAVRVRRLADEHVVIRHLELHWCEDRPLVRVQRV